MSTVLQVSDLKKHFPIKGGLLGTTVGQVYAVDGVSFDVSTRDQMTIRKIAARAHRIATEYGQKLDIITVGMDVTAAHCNGCPLNLVLLLESSDENFIHDIFGIEQHLNRETGKLEGLFEPRCAQQAK